MVNLANMPEHLRKYGLFCLWKYEERDGRKTKVPYNPNTLYRGDSTDKNAFCSFPAIAAKWDQIGGQFDGIGVGVFDQIGAIDIDHCIDHDRVLSELARDIVIDVNSYTEISPSGEGIRIFFGVLNTEWYDKQKYYINNRALGLEIYLPGTTSRFLTYTGDTLNGQPVRERTKRIETVLDKYMLRGSGSETGSGTAEPESPPTLPQWPPPALAISDSELLDKAAAAANGDSFRRLWCGNTTGYNSQSEADQALCNMLAFWTGRDAARMDALFRQSALMRDKWNRKQAGTTYGAITIQKAIRDCKEIYQPDRPPGRVIDIDGGQEQEAPPGPGTDSQPRGDPSQQPAPEIELVSLDTVEEKEIEWLIPGWIPKESTTILGAEGGAGKTSTWCHIVAKISAGKTTMFDDGYTERAPGTVLFFSSEDSADTVLKKKIRNEGGNMANIKTLDISSPLFNSITFENGGLLETLIRKYRPVLCVFDPVQQFIPDRVKMAERNAMRRCLAPLKHLSEMYHTTFIIICHANKRDGASGRKRLADSSDLWDFARSVIMLGVTEDNTRYLSQEKNNYGKLENSILFRISSDGLEYVGRTSKHDSDFVSAALAERSKPSIQRQDAEQFITDLLEHNGGRLEIGAITEAAKAADISDNAMRNAKSALIKAGTVKRYCKAPGQGSGTKWYLELETGLPQNDDQEEPPFD